LTNRKKGISLGSFEKFLVNSKAFGVKRIRTYKSNIILVTGKGAKLCVDPGGNGATMNAGGEGGPGPPGKGEGEQLVASSGGGQMFIGCQKT
jgi:hypothetical protein